jgi:hypothetical protein
MTLCKTMRPISQAAAQRRRRAPAACRAASRRPRWMPRPDQVPGPSRSCDWLGWLRFTSVAAACSNQGPYALGPLALGRGGTQANGDTHAPAVQTRGS